jgi:predicted peroxiredoxin
MTGGAGPERWVVLLQRFDDDALYEAAAMAASATSLGIAVTIVWFDSALEALVSDRLDERGERPASAAELFVAARETGLLRLLACSASAVNRRDRIEKIRKEVDDIVGWPTVISLMRSANKTFAW